MPKAEYWFLIFRPIKLCFLLRVCPSNHELQLLFFLVLFFFDCQFMFVCWQRLQKHIWYSEYSMKSKYTSMFSFFPFFCRLRFISNSNCCQTFCIIYCAVFQQTKKTFFFPFDAKNHIRHIICINVTQRATDDYSSLWNLWWEFCHKLNYVLKGNCKLVSHCLCLIIWNC